MICRCATILAFTVGLGAAMLWASVDVGLAQERPSGCRYITVQSKYTFDTVSGCVRLGSQGPEVQLPSGAWIPCEFGCANTLRSQTVDFWQWIDENSPGG